MRWAFRNCARLRVIPSPSRATAAGRRSAPRRPDAMDLPLFPKLGHVSTVKWGGVGLRARGGRGGHGRHHAAGGGPPSSSSRPQPSCARLVKVRACPPERTHHSCSLVPERQLQSTRPVHATHYPLSVFTFAVPIFGICHRDPREAVEAHPRAL